MPRRCLSALPAHQQGRALRTAFLTRTTPSQRTPRTARPEAGPSRAPSQAAPNPPGAVGKLYQERVTAQEKAQALPANVSSVLTEHLSGDTLLSLRDAERACVSDAAFRTSFMCFLYSFSMAGVTVTGDTA